MIDRECKEMVTFANRHMGEVGESGQANALSESITALATNFPDQF